MAATQDDIIIEQGANFRRYYELKRIDDTTFDLTGFSLRGHVRKDYDSGYVVLDLTNYLFIEEDAANGEILLSIPHEVTTALRFKGESMDYVYDIEAERLGVVIRLVQGTFTVGREITRV